jgi:cytochrome c peroxidase
MSFSLLRAPLRRVAISASIPRSHFRFSSRQFSTPPPPPPPSPKKSSANFYLGIGAAVAVGGLAFYYFEESGKAGTALKSGVQAVKAKTAFVPTQADYQKVGVKRSMAKPSYSPLTTTGV